MSGWLEWLRGKRLVVLLVFLGLFATYIGGRLTVDDFHRKGAASTLYGWDTSFYFVWLRSAVLDGDVDFENDLRLSNTMPDYEIVYAVEGLKRTDTGLVPNKYPVGWAVFHVPWFLAGHGVALGLDALGVDVRTDGYGTTYEVFLYAGSIFYAALSLWLTYQLLLRFFDRRVAWASLVLGWAVFHVPWFLAGHGVALGLDALGVDVRTDGYGTTYEMFLYAGSIFYAALSLWLTYQLLLRFFDRRVAWASLVLVWASSFLIFYQLRQYAMAHGLTYLCVVSAYYWIFAIREMPPLKRNWAMLGLSVGMLAITRYQAVVYLLFPFMIALWEIGSRRATLKAAAVCVATMAVPVALQLWCWKLLYGTWLLYTYGDEGFLWGDAAWGKTLFSPNHGLIYWHPIFAVGLVGVLVFVFSRRLALSWTWLVSILAVYCVNAAWHCWWFGVSFGNRAYEGVTLYLFFGVAALLQLAQGKPLAVRAGLWSVLVGLAIWNIGVMDVVIHGWITGVLLDGAEPLGKIARALLEWWF